MLTEKRRAEMTGHSNYIKASDDEKAEYLLDVTNEEFSMCRGFSHLTSVTYDKDAINLYNSLLDSIKKCNDNIKNNINKFIAFCRSLGIDDIFILRDLLEAGALEKLKVSKVSLIAMILDFKLEQNDNEIPRVEGEIISQATANRIINQHNLSNPPAVIDVVAREVDLNGQVQYADADNNAKLEYYKNVINSNIALQDEFYLPESQLKNLVDMFESPVFKQRMTEFGIVPNEYGPDFTELRNYTNMDRTRYNLCLTARTRDKHRNIIVTLNTANTDYISIFTDLRKVCNKSR